jgi:4,5-epoxidase
MMETAHVLVVGAGPTGLTLACALRLHGVAVRVVDRAAAPAATSRANFLHARGAEVLDRLGALGDLPERSISALTITVHVGGRPMSTVRFGDVGLRTARPALMVSQATVEGVLRDRLAELGGVIEWGTDVVGVTQDAAGVTARLDGGGTIRASWLVGCDGAHSIVRKQVGIGFPGAPVADTWLLADVHAEGMPERSGSHGWMHRDGLVGALPMKEVAGATDDSLWRLMLYTPGVAAEGLNEQQILDRIRVAFPQRTGLTSARIDDAVWASVFRIHRRLVDTYRSGRVLLAGDAAHIHSPIGGQGMLTGIGDAENLAFKLALVIDGRASESLLDTYEAERRPLATEVLRTTSANTRLQTSEGTFVRLIREKVLVPVFDLPIVQRWATAVASQLGVSYRRGPLGGGVRGRLGRRPRPGDRVPDVACRRVDGTATRLHAELGGRWAVLAPVASVEDLTGAARTWLGDHVRALVHDGGDAMLVRPDAHLAWRGRPDAHKVEGWLRAVLRPAGPHRTVSKVAA